MKLCVTGSIATDHLMTFAGRFGDSMIASELDSLSVSFLVEDLQIRRGGVGANIAFSLGCLGLRPILVGAVGEDFADYRSWLVRHDVDVEFIRVSEVHHTARFVCTTDSQSNQIASFYPGAMVEARAIELGPIVERVGPLDLVVISPNDPAAMLRHTEECRDRGIPFAADPSQQLAFLEGDDIRALVDGAAYLFTNEYEAALIEKKTGWSPQEILDRVGTRVTTKGDKGCVIQTDGDPAIEVPAVPISGVVDPTGVGDGFRSGYLAALSWGCDPQRSAQVGSAVAALVIETTGPQDYELDSAEFLDRFTAAYGAEAAAEIAAEITALS
ncbi:MAG: carbohydrate kinase family protein [Actinobacteria bacterium]|nr:carbohydrate kinase family protein [Actinomycetota bacterium]